MYGVFSGVKSAGGLALTTHPHLAPRLKKVYSSTSTSLFEGNLYFYFLNWSKRKTFQHQVYPYWALWPWRWKHQVLPNVCNYSLVDMPQHPRRSEPSRITATTTQILTIRVGGHVPLLLSAWPLARYLHALHETWFLSIGNSSFGC